MGAYLISHEGSETMSIQMRMRKNRVACAAGFFLFVSCFMAAGFAQVTKRKHSLEAIHGRLAKEVRHELVMLPYYSVFDNLTFRIEGIDGVVLMGQVVKPNLKQDAENVVRAIEATGKVVNNIEVLPLSPTDDRIRQVTFRAIYSQEGLDRYAMSAVPSIHIIVKNGNITLEGVAANQMDKELAGMAAKQVSGAFSVTNNLRLVSK
jgi:hyperosmotically inducible periplasmic protein